MDLVRYFVISVVRSAVSVVVRYFFISVGSSVVVSLVSSVVH